MIFCFILACSDHFLACFEAVLRPESMCSFDFGLFRSFFGPDFLKLLCGLNLCEVVLLHFGLFRSFFGFEAFVRPESL